MLQKHKLTSIYQSLTKTSKMITHTIYSSIILAILSEILFEFDPSFISATVLHSFCECTFSIQLATPLDLG